MSGGLTVGANGIRCLIDHAVLHRKILAVAAQNTSTKSNRLTVGDVFFDLLYRAMRIVVDIEGSVAANPKPFHGGVIVREVCLLLNRIKVGARGLVGDAAARRSPQADQMLEIRKRFASFWTLRKSVEHSPGKKICGTN